MALHLTDAGRYPAAPDLLRPSPSGFRYLAAAVAPPAGPPFVRRNARRTRLLADLKRAAAQLERQPDVRSVTVYRAVLIPPIRPRAGRSARFDVAVLVETSSPAAAEAVRTEPAYVQLARLLQDASADVYATSATCTRSLGDVDHHRQGLFLFNHFVGTDREDLTRLWEHLAAWYVAEAGLDNSTLLAPSDPAGFVLINHARWDGRGPLRLAVEQFRRRTFRTYVRANLRANGVVAMPVLARLA
ncbi:MAG: hypothetical protein EPN43_07200 [Jatrophihabitans sp.]|nr:MAG: hypothetical protein EPN43_07200 [Jatrophihabitans sp.]